MRSILMLAALTIISGIVGCGAVPQRPENHRDHARKATRQTWMGTKDAASTAAKRPLICKGAFGDKTIALELGGGVWMKLVLIPAGRFLRGGSHAVRILKPFYIGGTEVTQVQYQAVMGTNPSSFQGAQRPVEKVSWYDALKFCEKLSSKTGKAIRLPSEAEWEYTCRAGSTTKYSFGDDASLLGQYGWYERSSGGETHPVGRKKPNVWGLHDMHGNVWEWCLDHWNRGYSDLPSDGSACSTGDASRRVMRGGSWKSIARRCRAAKRFAYFPDDRNAYTGFRVVVSFSRTP